MSVVTPFHNTEGYLAECIESVLGQAYVNFEYILVDNRSTDRSGAIAVEYARRDPRIRVVATDELLPQITNYSRALERIAPESVYCKMVQADDWLFPRCLTEMVAVAKQHPLVAIVSSYRMIESDLHGVGLPPKETVLSGRDACRRFLLGGPFLFGSPTTVLYRSDVVRARRPFFEEGRLHDDTEAVYDVLASHDFGFVHQVLSFTRRSAASMTGSARDFLPHELDRLILLERYGGRYLTAEEHRSALAGARDLYYRGLGKQWLRERFGSRDDRFWEYQSAGLASVGVRVEPRLVQRAVRGLLAEFALPRALLGLRRSVRPSSWR